MSYGKNEEQKLAHCKNKTDKIKCSFVTIFVLLLLITAYLKVLLTAPSLLACSQSSNSLELFAAFEYWKKVHI